MSAENPEAPQGVDLSFLEGINQPVEPTPAPAPAAETLAQENTDDAAVRLFQTKIEEYPDRATARKHYKEIADSLGVSKQLGYKAEKRVEKWKSNKQKPRPMTMKIAKAEPPEPDPITPPVEPVNPPPQPDYPPAPQPFTPPPMYTDQTEKLQKVIEHQAPKAIEHVLEIVGGKMGANGEKGASFLDTQDREDLAILLPVIITKATGGTMTPEMTENVAIGSFAAQIALKGVKNRMLNSPQEPVKPAPKQASQPAPKPAEPTPAPKPAQPENKPTPAAEQDPQFNDTKPKWSKELPT